MPAKQTVSELVAAYERLYDDFNNRDIDDKNIDEPQFEKLAAAAKKIGRAKFQSKADMAAGQKFLDSGDNPSPRDWCFWKIDVYNRMRQFA
jgi:hypothetical protein